MSLKLSPSSVEQSSRQNEPLNKQMSASLSAGCNIRSATILCRLFTIHPAPIQDPCGCSPGNACAFLILIKVTWQLVRTMGRSLYSSLTAWNG